MRVGVSRHPGNVEADPRAGIYPERSNRIEAPGVSLDQHQGVLGGIDPVNDRRLRAGEVVSVGDSDNCGIGSGVDIYWVTVARCVVVAQRNYHALTKPRLKGPEFVLVIHHVDIPEVHRNHIRGEEGRARRIAVLAHTASGVHDRTRLRINGVHHQGGAGMAKHVQLTRR
jgi:hypothetical protein